VTVFSSQLEGLRLENAALRTKLEERTAEVSPPSADTAPAPQPAGAGGADAAVLREKQTQLDEVRWLPRGHGLQNFAQTERRHI
jgi:hypothetical protein